MRLIFVCVKSKKKRRNTAFRSDGRGPVYRGRIYRYGGVESAEAQQPAILA